VAVRFYVDADLIGLAKVLVAVRSDVTFPGDTGGLGIDGLNREPCPVDAGTLDVDWVPKVAGLGWVIITRDRHIRHRPAEREALIEHKARLVTLDARRQLDRWGQLEIVVTQWRAIEEMADLPGPWVYSASRTGLHKFL
jgi:hypothetical protein